MKAYRKRAMKGYEYNKKKSNRQERRHGRREAWDALNKADNSPSYRPTTYSIHRASVKQYGTYRETKPWWDGL